MGAVRGTVESVSSYVKTWSSFTMSLSDLIEHAYARHGHVCVSVRKAGHRCIEKRSLEALALALVDAHRVTKTQGELHTCHVVRRLGPHVELEPHAWDKHYPRPGVEGLDLDHLHMESKNVKV